MPVKYIVRVCLTIPMAWLIATVAHADDAIDFNRDIRPILSDKCFYCHGPDDDHREADLRLDVEASAKADLGGYFAIVPGNADASQLLNRILSEDEDERMPPVDTGKTISPKQRDLLRRWIDQGAEWSQHWAYVPPLKHAVPDIENKQWPSNWIDHFIAARLDQEGLAPSPEADRVTLIRRLSFDLTGLPPSPKEVAKFVDDNTPNAYENLVDRLLDSHHYGERMAVYWLDLVRFADTVGYHGDQDHNVSPYRDYVIDAFNENMPLDQFTREQLAGDLLPDATIDQKIATCYNRLLQTSHEGGVQPEEYLAIYAADRVRNFSGVWLGATMGCCQCHNHKFDPYTANDFYSMVAFFADIDEARHFKVGTNSLPSKRPPEIPVLSKRQRRALGELGERISELEANLETANDAAKAPLKEELAKAREKVEQIKKDVRTTMITVSIKPRTIRVLPRGDWLDDSGPIVGPAVPEFLGEIESDGRPTRLDLANWLTDAKTGVGGLTARVFANRFWYLMFGRGIANVLDDFGGQGEPPDHPQLLDNLAIELINSDWDIKQMMKLIAMSSAYRQSSLESDMLRERDPFNRLIARQSRFRLPAEMVRDNALAVSGLLVDEVGGGSVKPYQPAGYYRHLNFPTRKYAHDTDLGQWRRGLYVHWQRQFLHPMLKAFDAPSREECTAARPRSNTPLAALTLLNDPTFVEAARVFAEHILRECEGDNKARLEFAFRRALSRKPDTFEQQLLLDMHQRNRRGYAEDEAAARQLISTGQAPVADDLDAGDLAAWTMVARAILNLNETITRN